MSGQSYIQQLSIPLVSGFIGAFIGAFLNNYYINKKDKRQFEIKYLESQVKELYAPLLNLVEQSNNMYERVNNLVEGKIPPNRKNFEQLTSREQAIWKFFVEKYFIPIHKRIIELVISNSHLLKDAEPLPNYRKFWEYASDLEARHTLYVSNPQQFDTRNDAEAAEYPVRFSEKIESELKKIYKDLNNARKK